MYLCKWFGELEKHNSLAALNHALIKEPRFTFLITNVSGTYSGCRICSSKACTHMPFLVTHIKEKVKSMLPFTHFMEATTIA